MPTNEIARVVIKSALARATAGAEGALKVGSQLPGVAGTTVQAILASLKGMIGETRNQILTSDAQVSWGVTGASYLKWDSYIYFEPVPTGVTPDSWIGSMMPSSVLHTAGGERKNANGIFINTTEELWMIHPRGTGSENVTFEVVTYDSARQNELFSDPNAYLICYRDQSTTLRFTNGTTIPHGTNVDKLDRPYASTTQHGLVELATQAESWTQDETKAITPKGLSEVYSALYHFTNEARNNILSGGGLIKFGVDEANRLKWSTRFIFLPTKYDASSSNFISLNFPGSATAADNSERVNGNGILLNGWESLWFLVPRGSNGTSGVHYRVVSYTDTALLADLYSRTDAHLICTHNAEHSTLNFRNGLILPAGKQSQGGAPPTTPHNFFSANHSDVDHTDTPAVGEVLTFDSDSKWRSLPVGAATIPDASTATKGRTRMSTAPVDPAQPIAVGDNDTRILTNDENEAAQGTNGSPSNTNRFVTDSDGRNTNARTPTSHASSHAPGGSDPLAVDAAAGTGSLRTLGTSAQSAAAGNDARMVVGADPAYITPNGLIPRYVGTNALTVTAGAAYIQSLGRVVDVPSDIALTGMTLPNFGFVHLYLYMNGSTPAIEASTTAPAAPYRGNARSKTGDTSRRYLWTVKTSSSSFLIPFYAMNNQHMYRGSGISVVNGFGNQTTATTQNTSDAVPTTSRWVLLALSSFDITSGAEIISSEDGTVQYDLGKAATTTPGGARTQFQAWTYLNASQQFQARYTGASGTNLYATARGFILER